MMNLIWYWNRLKKMSAAEIFKRINESLYHYAERIKFRHPEKWPYERFADALPLVLQDLPYARMKFDSRVYPIYGHTINLEDAIDWYVSDLSGCKWPRQHYSKINFRPGNPHGDVRINWELNRLQFLPFLATKDASRTLAILRDWLRKNPYQYGPAYISSMEVAIRWFSIYRTAVMLKSELDTKLNRQLTGLAIVSGKFIDNHLSTHSSAGNHLIVEAVGLFWLGKALENRDLGQAWVKKARKILHEEFCRQLNQDGTNKEQTFWYLGFVIDAAFHYFILEKPELIPDVVRERVQQSLELMHTLAPGDNYFPDYGDRDDGVIFRLPDQTHASQFSGLLNIGAFMFNRDQWRRSNKLACQRLSFWIPPGQTEAARGEPIPAAPAKSEAGLKTYPDGGMTWMRYGKGTVLFRHAPLGLGRTCGHGHADALSILLSWNNRPLLIDLGSGQYNGDQNVRHFFRSTIAHNTVEAGGEDQSRMTGPFMWDKPYNTILLDKGSAPHLYAEAQHDGYKKRFSTVHKRRVAWKTSQHIEISDSFFCKGPLGIRGAFHLGPCKKLNPENNHCLAAEFDDLTLTFEFPLDFSIDVYYGSKTPFLGWCTTVYGAWEPAHTIIFSNELRGNYSYKIDLRITE